MPIIHTSAAGMEYEPSYSTYE